MIGKVFHSIIAAVLILGSSSAFSKDSGKRSVPIRVACVGDSITYGATVYNRGMNCYPAQLDLLLWGKAMVVNFGLNGATLLKKGDCPYWGKREYREALEFNPQVVVIKLGTTNDSRPVNWQYKSEFVSDYIDLIKSFRNLESKPVVWICYPAPAYPGRWGITDKVIKEEVIPLIDEVARKADVKIIDLYSALSDKKEMFPDTVHPTAAGAKIMAETIAEAITSGNL